MKGQLLETVADLKQLNVSQQQLNINYNHLMPTRYTIDVDLKSVVTSDVMENSSKRTEACKASKKALEERFATGKNRWFFSALKF